MACKTEHLQEHYDDVVRCLICSSKFCMRWCPSFEATKSEAVFSAGLNHFALGILTGLTEYTPSAVQRLYTCLSCGSCRDIRCVAEYLGPSVDSPAIVQAMRTDIVDSGIAPDVVEGIAVRTLETHNIFGDDPGRALPLDHWSALRPGETPEMVCFLGCVVRHKNPAMATAARRITQAVGTSTQLLPGEWCCGLPLLRMGFRSLAQQMAQHNVDVLNRSGARTIAFCCPSCHKAFTEVYPREFGLRLVPDACLLLEYVSQSLEGGGLQLTTDVSERVTIHDPCSLALARKEVNLQRTVLQQVPGLELVEMVRSGSQTRCCGGAIWVKELFPDLTKAHGQRRLQDAAETGARTIATACPNCWRALQEAARVNEANYAVRDIVELVADAL